MHAYFSVTPNMEIKGKHINEFYTYRSIFSILIVMLEFNKLQEQLTSKNKTYEQFNLMKLIYISYMRYTKNYFYRYLFSELLTYLTNKQHDMSNTKYDEFNLIVFLFEKVVLEKINLFKEWHCTIFLFFYLFLSLFFL